MLDQRLVIRLPLNLPIGDHQVHFQQTQIARQYVSLVTMSCDACHGQRKAGLYKIPTKRRFAPTGGKNWPSRRARRKASRSLRSGINTISNCVEVNGSECILCGGRIDVRPINCLSLLPMKYITFTGEQRETLSKDRELCSLGLQNVLPDELDYVEGSVMVMDETICIRCGTCAECRPLNTISMKAFEVFEQHFSLQRDEEIVLNS